MRPALRLSLPLALGWAACAYAQDISLPPPPDWVTPPARLALAHGVRLISEGNYEFAEGHFRAIPPPKPSMVYVNVSGAPPSYRGRAHKAAVAALQAWNTAASDLVQFERTDREDLADVVILFEFDVASREGSRLKLVCGTTAARMLHDGNHVYRSAVLRIAVYGEGVGRPGHSSASLAHVIGHELGHFLGLGESTDKTDIMGPDEHRKTPSTRPSPQDVQRVRELATLCEQLVTLARRGEKIEVPEAWQSAAHTHR